ncbi:MAG: hypothetical protein U0412_14385 [Nitrospira sp.]
MADTALTEQPAYLEDSLSAIEADILDQVEEQTVIDLDALVAFLPQYSWSQVFHAVDRLARRGGVTLRRYRSDYSLFSNQYAG